MTQLTNSTADLEQAYRSAIYRVLADPPFDLAVDQFSPGLAAWHRIHAVEQSALLTAYNPASRRLPSTVNRQRHIEFERNLKDWTTLASKNIDPNGHWPLERGLLVAGLTPDLARRMAARWGQKAWLQIDSGAVPRLMLVEDESLIRD